MASGDVWKVNLGFKWGTIECLPGFHLIEGSGGAGANPLDDVGLAVLAALGSDPLSEFSDALTLDHFVITQIQPGTFPTARFNFGALVGGVADANPLPPQTAGVISWKTGIKPVTGAFAALGRMYMPGCPQNGQISGFFQASHQNALSAFASLLFDAFVTDGTTYQLNIVSYTPGSKPVTVRAFNPVTSFSINPIVRSQRSREFGVGI